jgi:molybdate transport system ATP-binding protein
MTAGIRLDFAKRFPGGPEIRVTAQLARERPSVTVLFGPSGAGKTTVLRVLAGLLSPDHGAIEVGNRTWSDSARRIFVPARDRGVGFIPQDYSLFPHLTVEKNIAYGLNEQSRRERQARVDEMMTWLGLKGLEKRLPRELSGGQQQRVALGRAVARRPALLLLDEPLAALDAPTRSRLRKELRALLKEVGTTTILVTHDRTDASALGDELVVMDRGRVLQQGPPSEVFGRPVNLATAAIVAVETLQPGRLLDSGDLDLVTVAVGSQKLTAVRGDLPPGIIDVFISIRAEDVVLLKGDPVKSSARNCLAAIVRELSTEGPMVRLDLDCGFPLIALLTKPGVDDLQLKQGDSIWALIKAPNVHLIPRATI